MRATIAPGPSRPRTGHRGLRLGVVLATGLAGCLADLRPPPLDRRATPQAESRGRALLLAGERAQAGGRVRWHDVPGAQVELIDRYFGLLGAAICPWPSDPQRLRVAFRPGQDEAAVDLLDEHDTVAETWGVHGWNAWRRTPGQREEYEQDEDVLFWVSTVLYFLEGPLRLGREAEIVDWAGERVVDGVSYDLVYVTWDTYAPSDGVDQYLAWLRRDDGLLTRLDFTVRDVAGFLTYTAFYGDHRPVDGWLLPHRIAIGSAPDDLLHEYAVLSWAIGLHVESDRTAPQPRPPRQKQDRHR